MNRMAAWLVFAAYLGFASRWWRTVLARLSRWLGDWVVLLLLLPYLLAVRLRPAPLDLVRYVIYLALPTLLLRVRPRDARPFDLWHILTILAIWASVEPDVFLLLLGRAVPGVDVWTLAAGARLLPETQAVLLPGVDLPIHTLTAVLLVLFLCLVRHPLRGMDLSFALRGSDVRDASLGLLAFAVVGLPVGLAHLNNSTPGFPVPNWSYVLMAALAGLAYGWVWRPTKKVSAAALTHVSVNLVWSILFQ